MSAAQRPDQPTVALALRDPVAIGNLPDAVQQQLELRRLSNQVAGELAKMNWGAKLDLATRRAVADWGRQFRVDTTTEIFVLGGNVYLNAAFYIRKLSELIEAGLVEYAYADHIEDDPRLAKLGAEGEGEASRRLRERIMYQVPDKAASAVVFRVKLRSMDREVTGVKWCGNGTRKNDPVGDDKPVETAESRAARRAMRLVSTHVPKKVADELEAIEDSADVISERIAEAKQRVAVQEASVRRAPQLMPAVDANNPYKVDATGGTQAHDAVRIVPAPTSDATRHAAETAAVSPDPYGPDASSVGAEARSQSAASTDASATHASIDERAPLDTATTAAKREHTGPAAYRMPFTMGEAKVGTSIGDASTQDLTKALQFAAGVGKYEAFVESVSLHLDDRRAEEEERIATEAAK